MPGELVSFLVEWDQANLNSVRKNGIGKSQCEEMIGCLLSRSADLGLWIDTLNSQKERDGQRFVTVVQEASSGKGFFICFTVRDKGAEKAVRVLCVRPINRREPLLRENRPERFVQAPSLRQLLGV